MNLRVGLALAIVFVAFGIGAALGHAEQARAGQAYGATASR